MRTSIIAAALVVLSAAVAEAQWSTLNFVDEFGDVADRGAASVAARPTRPMAFPYGDVTARIFVNCDRAWIRFTEAPNITGGDIQDGYARYFVAVRMDGNATSRWRVRQSWGDEDLRFENGSQAISALASGSTFAVAISWYGQDSVAFSWSLTGSSEAIKASCD